MTPIESILERNIILNGADVLTAKGYTQVPNHVLVSDRLSPGAKPGFPICGRPPPCKVFYSALIRSLASICPAYLRART